MTTQQPEALRLADIVERLNVGVHSQAIAEEYTAAARELCRLHAENEELKQQIAANKPTQHGLDKFINEVGEVHLRRYQESSAHDHVCFNAYFNVEFGRYGANVCGKTLQEAIEKAIAAQSKHGCV